MKGFLKCSCEHCGGNIEFPGSAIDSVIACPHCGEQTSLRFDDEFQLEGEAEAESSPWNKLIITTVVLVVLTAITIGAIYFVKSKATKKGLLKPASAATTPETKPGNAGGNSEAKSSSANIAAALPAAPSAPEHVFDADPTKHRFPVEAARRAQPAGDIKTGREIYLGHCSECHVFHDPAAYPASQWSTILPKMMGKAKIGGAQREHLERFTQSLRAPGQ